MSDPYKRLREQVLEFVSDELEWMPQDSIGKSPIEKLFFTALWASIRFGMAEHRQMLVPADESELARAMRREEQDLIIIQPQMQAAGWCVDFLIYCWDPGHRSGKACWRGLIVECDGHDFHERTKEQAARDRSRDRTAQNADLGILRFTGRELYRDPAGCARQVIDWCAKFW